MEYDIIKKGSSMPHTTDPLSTFAILKKHHVHFKKDLGQNFLTDLNIAQRIVEEAQVTSDDAVLEIGAGVGSLTQFLARRAYHVYAVEVDKVLVPILEDTLSPYTNTTVIHQDILKMDLVSFFAERAVNRPIKVVANLPYYITTPILMGLLESTIPFRSITVMIQEEVAKRICATPGTKEYGALTLAVAYRAKAQILFRVPPACFVPQPKVYSTVLHLTCFEQPPIQIHNEDLLFTIIRAAFNQRRKTLPNALQGAISGRFDKEKVQNVLEELGLSQTVRGEALSLQQFCDFTNCYGLLCNS
ncbi:MAG: 16S rRNA (adenine(1518)-N(6)/adenine(1519)-N(6))-dimethyltransferase RsmA [Clostridium sp.]|jgi:16S rRNA (adenine1518-N6/adenine1519-N6)-dimethyltransferase|nr:16S rRNA (adenine(1518)-N(6)/adenine(1519)-N(6))-dimethyltransferase RsmA [Clostridium sp.]